jgi:hypothetical protein
MRNTLTAALFFMTTIFFAQSTGVTKWKTIDDQTGEAKSIIEIYEKEVKYMVK